MTEHTLTVSVDRLYVPHWVNYDAHVRIQTLVREGCDGGDGEYDEPADTILRRMYDRNTIKEWEALSVTSEFNFVVFQDLRIEFASTPPIKRCSACLRVMAEHECEADEERVCDQCVEARTASRISEHLERYLKRRAERTGLQWWVVERYQTPGPDYGGGHRTGPYHRALIVNGFGTLARIYYSTWKRCWRRS